MKIGVFDSGVGGLSVANALEDAFTEHEIIYAQDKKNVPYGSKTPEVLLSLVLPILKELGNNGCSIIVIACNSVSTTILDKLQDQLSATLIGVEPMIGLASKTTRTGVITVCATPATLNSRRYKELIKKFGQDIVILEPDCSDWASMIEHDTLDSSIIKQQVLNSCHQGSDVIVLGCTHYHWIEKLIKSCAGPFGCAVIQPEQSIIAEVALAIEQHD